MKRFTICLFIVFLFVSMSFVKSQNCLGPTITDTANVKGKLDPAQVTDVSATIKWNGGSDSIYTIRYINLDIPGSLFQYKKTGIGVTTFVLNGLSSNTDYQVQVESYCTFRDKSDYSYPVTFKTLEPKCKIPTGLSVSNIDAHDATLSWAANGDKYTVLYRVLGSPDWKFKSTAKNSINLSYLNSSTVYEWQVKSFCGNLKVYATGPMFATLASTCNTPNIVTPADITYHSATIIWDKCPDATMYKVRYYIRGDAVIHYKKTASNEITLKYLTPGSTYIVQVKTICGNIVLGYSGELSFTTPAKPVNVCLAPDNLQAYEISATTAKLSWSTCQLATQYIVEYYKKVGINKDPRTHFKRTALTPIILTGLKPGFTWGWHVRTQYFSDRTHQTDYSAEATFITPKSKRLIADNSTTDNNGDLLVYPNPSNGTFNVSAGNNQFDINIYNIQGRLIYTEKAIPANTIKEINLKGMPRGIYFLRITGNNEVKTSKLLIQ